MNPYARSALLAGVFFGLTGFGLTKDPPPAVRLDALLAIIKPQPGEDRWATIEWRTDLWQARQEAARLGRPILLWEMDGHPLGCV